MIKRNKKNVKEYDKMKSNMIYKSSNIIRYTVTKTLPLIHCTSPN